MRLRNRLDSMLFVCLFVYSMQNEGTLTCTAMCATRSSAHNELVCVFIFTLQTHIPQCISALYQHELKPALKYRNENCTTEWIQCLRRFLQSFHRKVHVSRHLAASLKQCDTEVEQIARKIEMWYKHRTPQWCQKYFSQNRKHDILTSPFTVSSRLTSSCRKVCILQAASVRRTPPLKSPQHSTRNSSERVMTGRWTSRSGIRTQHLPLWILFLSLQSSCRRRHACAMSAATIWTPLNTFFSPG